MAGQQSLRAPSPFVKFAKQSAHTATDQTQSGSLSSYAVFVWLDAQLPAEKYTKTLANQIKDDKSEEFRSTTLPFGIELKQQADL